MSKATGLPVKNHLNRTDRRICHKCLPKATVGLPVKNHLNRTDRRICHKCLPKATVGLPVKNQLNQTVINAHQKIKDYQNKTNQIESQQADIMMAQQELQG